MGERWNDRLTLPPTDLIERYIRGELQLGLRCQWKPGKPLPFHLFIERVSAADHERAERGEFEGDVRVPRANDQGKSLVFVLAVKIVQNRQRIVRRIRSVVRLEPINQGDGILRGDSLYLSTVSGQFLFCRRLDFGDGKTNPSLMTGSIVVVREHPCNVIERGSQMMCNLSGQDSEPGRDTSFCVELDKFLGSLLFVLTEASFRAFIKKGDNLGIEVLDSFIGPF